MTKIKIVLVNLLFISAAYIFEISYFHRTFLITFSIVATCLLLSEKLTTITLSRYIRRKGYNYRRILLVGTNSRAERFINLIKQHPEWGLRVVKILDNDPLRLNKILC